MRAKPLLDAELIALGIGHGDVSAAVLVEDVEHGGAQALARYEALHEPGDLAGWLALSRLHLDPASVHVTAGDVRQARRLRDALWRLARDAAHARPGRRTTWQSSTTPRPVPP